MLQINHVTKYYVKTKPVISDMSLKFPATGLNVIVGKSGCGKTTLLNMIGTMDQNYIGSIELDGVELSMLSYNKISDYRNYHSAYVFQLNSLFEHLTVKQNIEMALKLQNKQVNISEILEKVGLKGFETRRVKYLSGGERQRVSIARAIAKDCKVILADEPTSALDSNNSHKIFELLKEISKDKLVIVVTHDVKKAVLYADRMIKLVDGRVVEDNLINEPQNDKVKPIEKKLSKRGVLKPIFWSQFRKSLIIDLFIIMLMTIALTIANIAIEQQKVIREYQTFEAGEEIPFNELRTLTTHVANNVDYYHIVKAIETDEPFTLFKDIETRYGPLTQEDQELISDHLSGYNLHQTNPDYGNLIIRGISQRFPFWALNENSDAVHWDEFQRSNYSYYVYDEDNEYNLLHGRLPQAQHEILVTDTVALNYLQRQYSETDLTTMLNNTLTILDIYDTVPSLPRPAPHVYYYIVEKPYEVVGIIETNQDDFFFYDDVAIRFNLLSGFYRHSGDRDYPYMNPGQTNPYGYVVFMDHLDAYKNNIYFGNPVEVQNIFYQQTHLDVDYVNVFHGNYDYRGITNTYDNLEIDFYNRLYSRSTNEQYLDYNQILVTTDFIRAVFPGIGSNWQARNYYNANLAGDWEIELNFEGLNGEVTETFEVVGLANSTNSRVNGYFFISDDLYKELKTLNTPQMQPSMTIQLSGHTARERIDLINELYYMGYLLSPVNIVSGAFLEFIPQQGEIELVDNEGFSEIVNISLYHLFSDIYNTPEMREYNSVLEIAHSIYVFVLFMGIVLSIGFIYLKERRQRLTTMKLSQIGVPIHSINRINIISYVLTAILICGLTIIATYFAIEYLNNGFILTIAHEVDGEVIKTANIHRIRLIFTNTSVTIAICVSIVMFIISVMFTRTMTKKAKR